VLKREPGAWEGDVAGVLGGRACWSTAVHGEGRTETEAPQRSEGKWAHGGKGSWRGQVVPIGRPHWVEGRGVERRGEEIVADRWSPPIRLRGARGPAGLD
jgi:hypothetical protein